MQNNALKTYEENTRHTPKSSLQKPNTARSEVVVQFFHRLKRAQNMFWLSVRWIPDWITNCPNRTCYGLGIIYMAERWFKFSHLGGHLLEIGMEETKPGDVNGIQKRRQADRQRHDCVYGTQRDRLRQTKFQTKGARGGCGSRVAAYINVLFNI